MRSAGCGKSRIMPSDDETVIGFYSRSAPEPKVEIPTFMAFYEVRLIRIPDVRVSLRDLPTRRMTPSPLSNTADCEAMLLTQTQNPT